MKKLIVSLIACFSFVFTLSTAQAQFEKGQIDANLGIGLLPTFYGSGVDLTLPPIGLSVDYGVTDNISVGGYAAYASANFGSGFGSDWKYNYTIIGVRGAYHFDVGNEKFDTYAGGLLGYNIVSVNYGNSGITSGGAASAAAFSVFLGGRYRFTESLGAFAELGYGISVLQLGLNVKF